MKKTILGLSGLIAGVVTMITPALACSSYLMPPGKWENQTVVYVDWNHDTQGSNVEAVQWMLQADGQNLGSSNVDGYYGTNTENAIKAWQNEHNLTADGSVGPKTWKTFDGDLHVDSYGTDTTNWYFYDTKTGQSLQDFIQVTTNATAPAWAEPNPNGTSSSNYFLNMTGCFNDYYTGQLPSSYTG